MSDLRTAANQMLEALEGGADSWQLVGPAIDALKEALAEPEPCRYPDCVDNGPDGKCTRWLLAECSKSEDYKPKRPAEPVGVVTSMVKGGVTWHIWPDQMPDGTTLYAAAPIIKPEIKEDKPVPPPEAQTEAEKIAYCAGWWAALEAERKELLRIAEEP